MVYGVTTEVEDFTNALYYALPNWIRCPGEAIGYNDDAMNDRRETSWEGFPLKWPTKINDEIQRTRTDLSGKYTRTPKFRHTRLGKGSSTIQQRQAACDHRPTLQKKIRTVYDNFDDINWKRAGENLLLNEVGDRIGGMIGQTARKANKRLGRPVGIQFGPLH